MIFFKKGYRELPPNNINYPVMVLVKDGWDDYGHKILYNLSCYKSRSEVLEIGPVKILDEESTYTTLPDSFSQLEENFCSLGQSLEYYERIKEILPSEFEDVLSALNDLVVLPDLSKHFEIQPGFQSGLMRFSAAEKAFKEGWRLLFENIKLQMKICILTIQQGLKALMLIMKSFLILKRMMIYLLE
jgi:hypothetical protein